MNNSVFRKKSLERIDSPENLNSYLRVTSFPMWFAIIAVMVLLVSAIIWGAVDTIETKVDGTAQVLDDEKICYISEKYVSEVSEGTVIYINDAKCTVTAVSDSAVAAESAMSEYCMSLGGFEEGEEVYALEFDGDAVNGNYQCRIVIEEISPISFLLNNDN